MNQFAHYLKDTTVGDPVASGNLAMFPLYRADPSGDGGGGGGKVKPADYLCFDDALAKKWVDVTEVDEAGSVPTLLLDNRATQPVFLLDGEQLIGAKQNRTVNLTLLVAAGAKTEIPVSCVEAGRWSRSSRRFRGSRNIHYSRGRRDKMAQVNRNLRHNRSRRADQGQVWNSITEKRARFAGVSAPTDAMDDIYAHAAPRLGDYERDLKAAPEQVGVVFAIDGRVSGFDLFADAGHCAKYFPKLVRSHALDAMETAGETGAAAETEAAAQTETAAQTGTAATRESVTAFLKGFDDATEEVHDAVGLGRDLRVEAPQAIGAGLVWDERCIHLAGFPKDA